MIRDILLHLLDLTYVIGGKESQYSIFKEYKKSEYDSKDKINESVVNKLNLIVKHAYDNVPIYKRLYENVGINAGSIDSTDDLHHLPILDKSIIRHNFPDNTIDANLKARAMYNTTSGSTGEPLEFYNDRLAEPYRTASFMFFNSWMGVKPFDKHWNLKSVGNYSLKQKTWFWLVQKHFHHVFDVKKESIPAILNEINELKPSYIEGYSGSLVKLTRYLDELGLGLDFDLKAIIATSENLLNSRRDLMEKVFDCKVYNRYGSREFCGALAQECSESEGLHINPYLCYIEIVDDNGEPVDEGESGKILVTDLHNFVMPFIRYEIGDVGVKGSNDNSCGRNFQTIKSIVGREGEFIISSKGEKIPFVTISAYLFRRLYPPYVYSYQFVQEERGEILLKIIPTPRITEDIINEMHNTLQTLLPTFTVELQVVDDIPVGKSGKTPFIKTVT